VRLCSTYAGDRAVADVLRHSHEVLAIAFHPAGRFLVCSTLNGELHFWDAQEATIRATIEARPAPQRSHS
jgi:WD40 repeat protein